MVTPNGCSVEKPSVSAARNCLAVKSHYAFKSACHPRIRIKILILLQLSFSCRHGVRKMWGLKVRSKPFFVSNSKIHCIKMIIDSYISPWVHAQSISGLTGNMSKQTLENSISNYDPDRILSLLLLLKFCEGFLHFLSISLSEKVVFSPLHYV